MAKIQIPFTVTAVDTVLATAVNSFNIRIASIDPELIIEVGSYFATGRAGSFYIFWATYRKP